MSDGEILGKLKWDTSSSIPVFMPQTLIIEHIPGAWNCVWSWRYRDGEKALSWAPHSQLEEMSCDGDDDDDDCDYYCDNNVLGAFGDGDFSEPPEGSRHSYKDRGTIISLSVQTSLLCSPLSCLKDVHFPYTWAGMRTAMAQSCPSTPTRCLLSAAPCRVCNEWAH